MKLTVRPAANEDVYTDVVRVDEKYRLDARGSVVPEGSVCEIASPGRVSYGILRGLRGSSEPYICVDERLRNLLQIDVGDEVEVQFKPVGPLGQFLWAWNASDPAYRVTARMALLSVVLGLLGLLLGLLGLVLGLLSPRGTPS